MLETPPELTSGGDCTLHFHSADRAPTHDTLARLQDLERAVSVTADYTVRREDDIILVDATAGVVVVTLLVARGGKHQTVIRTAGANNVTVTPAGTDTINGGATATVSSSYTPLRLKALAGTGWITI